MESFYKRKFLIEECSMNFSIEILLIRGCHKLNVKTVGILTLIIINNVKIFCLVRRRRGRDEGRIATSIRRE